MKDGGSRPSSMNLEEEEEKRGTIMEVPLNDQHARDSKDDQMEFVRKHTLESKSPAKRSMQKSIRSNSMNNGNQSSFLKRFVFCCAANNV